MENKLLYGITFTAFHKAVQKICTDILRNGTFIERKVTKMDHIDMKLISLLQENARMPLKAMAEKVFLSSPAVSARIDRLVKDGIITGFHASIDEAKLGFPIKAFINLEMEPLQKSEFYPYIQSIPNVLECSCVTGSYSMLLKVIFKSTRDLDTFINHLQRFGRTSTQIVFSTSVEPRGISPESAEEGKPAESDIPKKRSNL